MFLISNLLSLQNITVRRVKKDGVCHISPLPPNLPRPNDLAAGLKMVNLVAALSYAVLLSSDSLEVFSTTYVETCNFMGRPQKIFN